MTLGMLVWLASGCVVPAPDLSGTPEDTDEPVEETETDTVIEPSGITVLVLDDGGSADDLVPALEAAGHEVKGTRLYSDWTGSNPNLDSVDVIVFLQGRSFSDALPEGGDQAIVDFVADGGGLIRTELASFAATFPPSMDVDQSMPVEYLDGPLEDAEWWVEMRGHPLVEGLPEKWTEPGGYAEVAVIGDGVTVIGSRAQVSIVTWQEMGDGKVVHVNHDMTATVSHLSDNVLRLMSNAVTFLAD